MVRKQDSWGHCFRSQLGCPQEGPTEMEIKAALLGVGAIHSDHPPQARGGSQKQPGEPRGCPQGQWSQALHMRFRTLHLHCNRCRDRKVSIRLGCICSCLLISGMPCSLGIFPMFSFFFSSFGLFRATPAAYRSSQARGGIGTAAAALCHSHSNAESEPYLGPTPQLMAMWDP